MVKQALGPYCVFCDSSENFFFFVKLDLRLEKKVFFQVLNTIYNLVMVYVKGYYHQSLCLIETYHRSKSNNSWILLCWKKIS